MCKIINVAYMQNLQNVAYMQNLHFIKYEHVQNLQNVAYMQNLQNVAYMQNLQNVAYMQNLQNVASFLYCYHKLFTLFPQQHQKIKMKKMKMKAWHKKNQEPETCYKYQKKTRVPNLLLPKR